MMKLVKTKEQLDIIEAAQKQNRLLINAAAGASKTTTLNFIAEVIKKPSLYLAFNKAIAVEASGKFPDHVECRTTHSLAYSSFGFDLQHKMSRPKGRYVNVAATSLEVARYYKLPTLECTLTDGDTKEISAGCLGLIVRETVKRFEQSADKEVGKNHIPHTQLKKLIPCSITRSEAAELILKTSRQCWQDRCDVHSDVMATHGTYLKLFQLSNPKLEYEVIYLDEAQDTSDVVIDIFLKQQHAKLIAVGDTYQAIYGWNGAVNAMNKLPFPKKQLTKSFRFGQSIADVATAVIQGKLKVEGFERVSSIIDDINTKKPYTMIFRGNAALLQEAVSLISQGNKVSVEVDTGDFIKVLDSAVALQKGDMKNVKHDLVVPYSCWKDFVDVAKESGEIKRIVSIILEGKAPMFRATLSKVCKRDDADITLTTCHKSKGREWDQVMLADDFPKWSESIPQEEINLMYVAATRVMKVLQINQSVFDAIKDYRQSLQAFNKYVRKELGDIESDYQD